MKVSSNPTMVLVIQKTSLQDWKKSGGGGGGGRKGFQNPIPDVNFLCDCSNHSTILALGSHKLETHQKNLMIPPDLDWKVGSLNPKLLLLTLPLLNSDSPQSSQTGKLATTPKPKWPKKPTPDKQKNATKITARKTVGKDPLPYQLPLANPSRHLESSKRATQFTSTHLAAPQQQQQQQQHIVNSSFFLPLLSSPLLSSCIESEQVQLFLVKFTATQRVKSCTRYNTAAAALFGVPVPQQQLLGNGKEGKEGVELGSRQERHQNTKPFGRLHSS